MKKYLLLITLGFFTLTNFAQTGMPNGLDGGKYTPKSNEKKNKKKSSSIDYPNTITLSLGHLFRGGIVYSYERKIKTHISLQGSLGVLVLPDYVTAVFNDNSSNSNYNVEKTYPNYGFGGNTFIFKPNNLYGDITAKYNTQIYDLDSYVAAAYNFYASVNIRKYRQAYRFVESQDIHPSSVEFLPVNNTGIFLQVGEMLYKESGMTYEYYIGLGYLNTSFHTLKYVNDQINYIDKYVYNSSATNKTRMQFTVGFKYGFSF